MPMAGRGRPRKTDGNADSRQKIIDSAAKLIAEEGAESLTVRRILEESGLSSGTFYHFFRDRNDLMMSFVKDPGFESVSLGTPENDVAGRVCELYRMLVSRYLELGNGFMKHFYTTDNESLASYMGSGYEYEKGTVMCRCLDELEDAKSRGLLSGNTEEMTADICTIVKGCVFDQCLTGRRDVFEVMERIISAYLGPHLLKGAQRHVIRIFRDGKLARYRRPHLGKDGNPGRRHPRCNAPQTLRI
ncbi:MAG: helix-turn-helix transcriptional regulator [Thermoplasmata archaeon]|nr:helix-turn-helix transcriptional regulator [Thermoplasmata archaeon]